MKFCFIPHPSSLILHPSSLSLWRNDANTSARPALAHAQMDETTPADPARYCDTGVRRWFHTGQAYNHPAGCAERDAVPPCENGTGDVQRAKSVARD